MPVIYPPEEISQRWTGALEGRLRRAPLERFLARNGLALAPSGRAQLSDNLQVIAAITNGDLDWATDGITDPETTFVAKSPDKVEQARQKPAPLSFSAMHCSSSRARRMFCFHFSRNISPSWLQRTNICMRSVLICLLTTVIASQHLYANSVRSTVWARIIEARLRGTIRYQSGHLPKPHNLDYSLLEVFSSGTFFRGIIKNFHEDPKYPRKPMKHNH